MKQDLCIRTIIGLTSILVLCCSASAIAQSNADPAAGDPASEQPPPPRIDYDSEPPYTVYERSWNRRFPQPYRQGFREENYPYGRPYYSRRYRSSYPPGRGYPEPNYYGFPPTEYFDDGYVDGFRDGRRFQDWQKQAEIGQASYLKAMRQGVAAFQAGDYGAASRQFILAARLNQGDPTARLRIAHALVALGHYDDAAPALRRALQLQPRLVYLPLDIRGEYGQRGDFLTHLAKLESSAQGADDDPDLWLLLGYYQFFSGRQTEAVGSLKRARTLAPDDSTTKLMHQAVYLSVPNQELPAQKSANPNPRT